MYLFLYLDWKIFFFNEGELLIFCLIFSGIFLEMLIIKVLCVVIIVNEIMWFIVFKLFIFLDVVVKVVV